VIHGIILQVENESFVLETRSTKIQYEPAAATRDAEVVDQLRLFDWTDGT